ncbi:MAG: efflux RND transporter permease subunit, partial [Gemmatimonadota bacterium]
MFDFLPRLAVERPVLTTMLVVTSLVLGIFGFSRLQTDLFPEIEFPVVSVSAVYPGAGPEEIEQQVTDPIEEAVSSLAGIDDLRSFSQENVAIVILQFELNVDPDQAAIDVRDRVEAIRGILPDEVEAPIVQRFEIGAMPIIDIALSGPQGPDALFELADEDLSERISRVSGVAGIQIVGGRQAEIEVLVDPERLQAYGLTLQDVTGLIGAENVSVPSGQIIGPESETPVRVVGQYETVEELEELRLFVPGGQVVRLGDIAVVRSGYQEMRQIARYNGVPAVSMSIQKRSDANPVSTSAGVQAELEQIRAELPVGTELVVVRDQSTFIQDSINDVLVNLLIGILLTTGVLFLFLHSWRGTVIAALAMPVTIVSTFLLMDLAGFTLNVMTLMALSITVGILVTNTIVVLENVYRHLDLGEDPRGAARKGTTEVAVAVAASTLTNLVVFTPIAFMEGIIGQFFYAFGLTVVFATIFSIFISFTLAPLLAARLLRANETEHEESEGALAPIWRRWDAAYRSLESSYAGGLKWALSRPRNGWIVIATTTVFSISALVLAGSFVGGEFIPSGDEGAIQVTLELPSGTSLERTSEVAAAAEQRIGSIPDVESTLTTISGGGGGGGLSIGGGANSATILVTLDDEGRSSQEVLTEVRPLLADLPDTEITALAVDPSALGGAQAPVVVEVSGPDYATLQTLAGDLEARLSARPELTDVTSSVEEPRSELVFRPDRATIADYGLTVGEVGQVLRSSVEGTIAGVFRGEVGRERDIRVRLAEGARADPAQVRELQVRTPSGSVALAGLGELSQVLSPTAIQRVDRTRTIEVTAQLADGAALTVAVAAVEEAMAEAPLLPGYDWQIAGESEQFGEAIGAVLVALLLAIILTYIVLAMILESFVHPITIMITLPLGAVGAMLGLFLWGASLNIFSMMAIIMLVGIVVN